MPVLRIEHDWLALRGRSLAEVEAEAIRCSFLRHHGDRRRMMQELHMGRTTLLRKLLKLGLRQSRKPRHLREADLLKVFLRHRRLIAMELGISDSTFVRWINKSAPFAVEE